MGTHGLFGFFYKKKYYVVYNHWDSYPGGLGVNIVNELKRAIDKGFLGQWIDLLEKMVLVDEHIPPTQEQIEKLKHYANLSVSRRTYTDWYCLLHGCQGSIDSVLTAGHIINYVDDHGTPQWEEYAYIVNLDTQKLDFFDGDNLVRSYEFDQLPQWDKNS